ncbi:uncharacterized protein LOC135399261 isoform X2 [Ornithodoros turicata]|uniref:uncharacterized protein LOC135399261 isoform X2 n=1 Tax=Ornithodoros turicata TaxID=34597 RepID=UPI003138B27E
MRAVDISLALLLLVVAESHGQYQDCSASKVQQCENNIAALHVKVGLDQSPPRQLEVCSDLRKNINCLLNFTANCASFDQKTKYARALTQARKRAFDSCEIQDAVHEYWKDGECFGKKELKGCLQDFEERNKKRNSPPAYPSDHECRLYMDYQRCVRKSVSAGCPSLWEEFIGLHLIDSAERYSWICNDNYQSPSFGENVPPSSAAINAPTCNALIAPDVKRCNAQFSRQTAPPKSRGRGEKDPRDTLTDEEARTKTCCAFGEYTYCLQSASKRKCSASSTELVRIILRNTEELIGLHCTEDYSYGSNMCSGALQSSAVFFLVALLGISAYVVH